MRLDIDPTGTKSNHAPTNSLGPGSGPGGPLTERDSQEDLLDPGTLP